ncbi:MAG: hemolysin III family protein [Treponema sp.]|nr:hemolysin III family protein [Treponema sp.]
MADISERIRRKSYAAKKKAAVRSLKIQTKEKIRALDLMYAENPEQVKARIAEKERKRALRIQKQNARMAYNSRQPRQYTLGEDIFNSISHGVGAGLSVAALVLLIIRAATGFASPKIVTAYSIFGASLFVMYMMSTLYHALTPHLARKVFSILDHAAVYFLIGGTCTPLIFAYFGNAFVLPLSILWGVLAALIALYCVFGVRLQDFAAFTYIVIGWGMTIFFFNARPAGLEINRMILLAGSIAYTVGGIFAALGKRYRGPHCVFHVFALAGSVLHFMVIYNMYFIV